MSSEHAVPDAVVFIDAHGRKTNIANRNPRTLLALLKEQPLPAEPMRHPNSAILGPLREEFGVRVSAVTQGYLRSQFPGEETLAFRRLLDTQRETVHQHAQSPQPKARHPFVPPGGHPPDHELNQQHKRAHRAMLQGNPGRALDALMKPPSASSLTVDDIKKIHSLHPYASILTLPPSLVPTAKELALVPLVSVKSVTSVFNSINRKSAAGHSGMTHEFLRAMFTGKFKAFADLANAILHSAVPPDPSLSAGVLALQPKFDHKGAPNGVRPTVTKEPLVTLAVRAALLTERDKMRAAIKPGQYSMASDGTKLAALEMLLKLGTDPKLHTTMLDKSNAFNAHSRIQMLLAVREFLPSLYPIFYRLYAIPIPIYFKGVLVCYASNGTSQGCLLAMFGHTMFDQVMKRNALLQRFPALQGQPAPQGVRYADDEMLAHLPKMVDIDVGIIRKVLQENDADLNDDKTGTFAPSHVNDSTSSTSMFGMFVGNSIGVRDLTTKFIEDWNKQVRAVRIFATPYPVDAWYIFATSLYQSMDSFARTNHLSSHELDKVNETILTEVRLHLDVLDLPWKKIMAPLMNGGVGLMPIRNSAHAVRLKLLSKLPSPPPGQPSLPTRLLSFYRRCDPNVTVLPVDEVSPNEPQGDPVELDDWRKPVPLPRGPFGAFSSFLTSTETMLPHAVFLAAVKIHLGLAPLPVLEGPHTANARDLVLTFYASFSIRNTPVPLDFRPKSFTPIAKNLAPFLARALAPVVAHCVGIIALGSHMDPAFVPPPRAVSPLPGPIAPQKPLPVAPDGNPYNPKRLVVAGEQQAEAPAAPVVVDVPAAAEPLADPVAVAPPAVVPDPAVAVVPDPPAVEQPPAAAAAADAPAAPLPPEKPPDKPGRRLASAYFDGAPDVAALSLASAAKKPRAAAEPPAELNAAAAAAPAAAPNTDAAASAEEEQKTDQPPSSPSAALPADHSAAAAKRPLHGPDPDAIDAPVDDDPVEHQRKAPRIFDPHDFEAAAALFDEDLALPTVRNPV